MSKCPWIAAVRRYGYGPKLLWESLIYITLTKRSEFQFRAPFHKSNSLLIQNQTWIGEISRKFYTPFAAQVSRVVFITMVFFQGNYWTDRSKLIMVWVSLTWKKNLQFCAAMKKLPSCFVPFLVLHPAQAQSTETWVGGRRVFLG